MKTAGESTKDGAGLDRVTSHALQSDPEDLTPAGSGNSTPLSDYSPHSQPFAERPENRTMAGMAARQTLSALPSPPPFTPAAGQSSSTPQMSAAGSNNNMRHAWSPAAPADTPGVTSGWQPAIHSPASSSVTFAFRPVSTGEAASPDAQPFGHAEQTQSAQQQSCTAAHKAADLVRAAERKLSASHDSDAMSDASGSIASTNTSARSSSMPAGSPGDILRAATSKLSAQHAISGSSRIQNPQRRKSGALKTPMQQKVAHAPTPHSTPMLDSPEMRRSDDLAMQVDDTADSSKAAVAATPGSGGAKSGSIAPQSSGSLKVHVTGSPPAASPSKNTKSPGSRSSVVSIGSVCGAAGPGTSLTPQQVPGRVNDEIEAGKYTPTMRLDFGGTTPGPTPAHSVLAASTPSSILADRAAADTSGSISPMPSFDIGEVGTPTGTTPIGPLPDDLTGLADKLMYSANKQVLRSAWELEDAARRQDQLQAALQEAGTDAVASLGSPPAEENDATMPWNQYTAQQQSRSSSGWFTRSRPYIYLALVALLIASVSLVAVQWLPPTALPPGMSCTPENAGACRAVLEAKLRAAGKEPSKWQLAGLRAKWYVEDAVTVLWTRRLPEGVTREDLNRPWLRKMDSKQLQQMSHEDALKFFSDLNQHELTPEVSARLAAAVAHKNQVEAEAAQKDAARRAAEEARIAAERVEAERVAREKAEAERRAAEEARIARERAEAARIAREKAEAERLAALRAAEEARIAAEKAKAERIARQRAEAERIAKERAEAERKAREEAERIAREKAEAEREREEAKRIAAEEARAAAQRAKAERLDRERAEAERIAAAEAEAERLAAERAAEEARLAAEAAEAERLAAQRAKEAETEAEQRAGHEQAEREAAAAAAAADTAGTQAEHVAGSGPVAGKSWLPYAALFVLLLSLGGGGGYVWHSQQQAAKAAGRKQQLDDIRTDFDEAEGQAYQDLGDMDPDLQQEGAAAGASAAAAAVCAADALAAGVSLASRVLTPRMKAPRPGSGRRNQDDDDNQGILSDGDGAGSSRAAAAAGTPRSLRRGSKAAAADAGADSDAGASTGKARGGRGRKAAAATPGRALEPLLEDAPAEPQAPGAAAAAGDEGAEAEAAPKARSRASRRQSAPAAGAPAAMAGAARRRISEAAAAAELAAGAEASATPARRSTRAARTPRV